MPLTLRSSAVPHNHPEVTSPRHIPRMSVVDELLTLLELEKLEVNIYRGRNRDLGTGRVFGGQVFAQALVAARRTVDEAREAHSVHGYFLRSGDLKAPIVFFVDRPRDGGTFTSRRVTAIQHGEAIFHLSASFHAPEGGLDHQSTMPDVPSPESLPTELEQIRDHLDAFPPELRSVLTQERPLDIRTDMPYVPGRVHSKVPLRYFWVRAVERLPDDPIAHQAILAYVSDYGFLPTALAPHDIQYRDPKLFLASLDHTLWMHRPFRADEWLLYVMDSPTAANARGFVRGQVFTRDGTLVASTAQEGLLRIKTP
jgi:acyl-CoA thioesterase-2